MTANVDNTPVINILFEKSMLQNFLWKLEQSDGRLYYCTDNAIRSIEANNEHLISPAAIRSKKLEE